jgi:hypothetical protein
MLNRRFIVSKPLKIIMALAVIISFSLFGTTLGMYVKEVGLFSSGRVGPRYYAFEVENNSSPQSVAPGESATFAFTVKNYDNGGVAQVPLKVAIAATYPMSLAGTGRVVAELKNGGTVLAVSDNGTLECGGLELSSAVNDTDQYTLSLTWLDADLIILGGMTTAVFDPSQVNIRVSGYQ